MLLRLGLGSPTESRHRGGARARALAQGFRTGDIMEPGKTCLGCVAMGAKVVENL